MPLGMLKAMDKCLIKTKYIKSTKSITTIQGVKYSVRVILDSIVIRIDT
jgi:hypothetical protein